jgi:hypothetical protein
METDTPRKHSEGYRALTVKEGTPIVRILSDAEFDEEIHARTSAHKFYPRDGDGNSDYSGMRACILDFRDSPQELLIRASAMPVESTTIHPDSTLAPALFDLDTVKMDSPRLRAIKELDIQTHHYPPCAPFQWIAVPMNAAKKMLDGYDLVNINTITDIMLCYSRLLFDAGMVFEGHTEKEVQDAAIAWCESNQ